MSAQPESWRGLATQFAQALLRPRRAPPLQVSAPDARWALQRYNVYRNNVVVKLVAALAAVFPALERITGKEFFRTMTLVYVRGNLPCSPLLFEYGRTFPDFIAKYPPARHMPWLEDTARIERAWLDSYHAADAQPLQRRHLHEIPSTRLAELRLIAHPAMRIVRSVYPAFTIFTLNRAEAIVRAIEDIRPEDTLITRPGVDVQVMRLEAGVAQFLGQLAAGMALGTAAETSLNVDPTFNLPAAIATAIASGAFTAPEGS